MSFVTTAVVLVSWYESRANVRAACAAGWHPTRPHDALGCASTPDGDDPAALNGWGGSKFPESEVLAGGFNYLDLDALRDFLLRTLQEPFVLCHSTQEDASWTTEALDPRNV